MIIIFGFIIIIAILYSNGIHDMNEKFPNYKGEDFLSIPGMDPFKGN